MGGVLWFSESSRSGTAAQRGQTSRPAWCERGDQKIYLMKSIFIILILLISILILGSNTDSSEAMAVSRFQMPVARYCPEAKMYATDCTAEGMGCDLVKCKVSNT